MRLFRPHGVFDNHDAQSFKKKRFMSQSEMKSINALIMHGVYLGLYSLVKYLHVPFFNYFRYLIVKAFSSNINSSSISDGVTIWFPWNVNIGKHSTLNQGVIIDGFGGVKIGVGVRIAAYTCINTADHSFSDSSKFIKDQGYEVAGVEIEDDVWLGSGVKINKGVTIGKGSVIGSGSVVTKDIPPYSIAVGVPCKVVDSRKD